MASCKSDELQSDSKEVTLASESCPNEITEELQASESNATVKAQKSGKFRRTALTFFGVRKTICILPSFLVGRSKNLSKWSSKKALFKSKTHDGLSKACQDDNLRSGYASAGDFVYHGHRDAAGDLHSSCHKKSSPPSADQKSLSLTRHKRGLRSLFQSIKQHRNNRNGVDKAEMFAMSSTQSETDVPVVQDYTEQYFDECLGSEPDVPDFNSIGAECTREDISEKCVLMQESPKSELSDNQIEDINVVAIVSSDFGEMSRVHSDPCLKLEMAPEPALKPVASTGSSDQLNLMFDEVASLKSFDSLTGCGDIIADQEDDSISESTVSGERSRNGGKRASCYLTYQGGGEDMASPEDLDEECLESLWVNDASEEMCCAFSNQDHTEMSAELTCSHNLDLLNSSSTQKGTDSSTADAITPQSEHQESAPNSDEGYYDSTTPGPEEGQEKADRLRPVRILRDSYSGDALYELFAPDESLISPHYENKSKLPSSNDCEYLNRPVDFPDSAFLPDMNNFQISADLYKGHSFLERPSTCSESLDQAQAPVDLNEMGFNLQISNLKPQALVNKNIVSSVSAEKYPNKDYDKRHSSISFGISSDPDFETFCEPKEQHLEENKPVALPYKNNNTQCTDLSCDDDDGQAVCFSQALENYTKHTQMMSNLDNNVDGLETNSAFIPNMEALPAIVTFDVVDMHNEGEYDDQIQMDLEEDLSSPYQEFEESYLQKDAFAECDYQMLDIYEQNLLSNTWAIASLPRHLGLTRVSQSMPTPLSLDRRSRSLDTEGLDLNIPETHRDSGGLSSCFVTEKDRGLSYYKKCFLVPPKDGSFSASAWQTRSEIALSLSLTDMKITEIQSVNQAQVKTKTSSTSGIDFNTKSLRLCSSTSDSASSELFSSPDVYSRHCHLPLQTDSCLPHSTFYYTEMIEDSPLLNDEDVNMLAYNSSIKSKPAAREGMAQCVSPLNPALSTDQSNFDQFGEMVSPKSTRNT